MSEVYRIQPTSLSGANSFLHRAFLKRGCVQAEMYAGRPGPCKAVRVLYTVIKPPSGSMHARQASSIKRKEIGRASCRESVEVVEGEGAGNEQTRGEDAERRAGATSAA